MQSRIKIFVYPHTYIYPVPENTDIFVGEIDSNEMEKVWKKKSLNFASNQEGGGNMFLVGSSLMRNQWIIFHNIWPSKQQ